MKIAIPVYKNTVSNTFDFARKLLVVTIEDGSETQRSEVEIAGRAPAQRAVQVKGLGVHVVICGAVSHILADMIEMAGIEIVPYITGSIGEVLPAYLSGELTGHRYRMPGCRRGLRKGLRGGARWRHGIRYIHIYKRGKKDESGNNRTGEGQ